MIQINEQKDKARIGWIGTGIMGTPMAMHLVKAGLQLGVYNRTASKAEDLISRGCRWFNNPADLAGECDIIFTIVSYPSDVEEVYFGREGVFRSLRENTILVDMSTSKPGLAVKIYESARRKDAWSLDAPVSGGQLGARNGTLSVMVGGDRDICEKLRPFLALFSKNIVYQGGAGAGQHTKMCNQIVIAGTMIGVCESLLYGRKAGLDLSTVLTSIGKGAAACWSLDVLAPKILQGDFEPGFLVEHLIKDLGIALEEAGKMELALPGLSLAKELYESLLEEDKGSKGTQTLYLALDKLSEGKNQLGEA